MMQNYKYGKNNVNWLSLDYMYTGKTQVCREEDNTMAKSKSTSSSRLLTRPLPPKATSLIKSGARVAQWVRSLDLTAHTSLSPIQHGLAPSFVN
jgi:hypothetical protein